VENAFRAGVFAHALAPGHRKSGLFQSRRWLHRIAARAGQEQGVWYRRQRFHRSISLDIRHSFTARDYWNRFGKTRPDFFQLLPDGTRGPDPTWFSGRTDLIGMAVGNPDL
jgi:hypothetical protein